MTRRKEDDKIQLVQKFEQKKRKEDNMAFNYDKLKGRIIEKFGTQYRFAKAMGWSERTLCLKLNSERPWKQTDICKAVELLKLTQEYIPKYFFKEKVQNIEL